MLKELISDTEAFLKKNLILVNSGFGGESKKPVPMRLTEMGTVRDINGGTVTHYSLDCNPNGAAGPEDHDFKGYWCHYDPGSTHYLYLGRDAQFMFTDTMNGCSFGVGIPDNHGSVLVGHSNLPGADESRQNSILADKLGGGTVLTSTFYRGTKVVQPATRPSWWGRNVMNEMGTPAQVMRTLNDATTLGVFRQRKWMFYTQMYSRVNNNGSMDCTLMGSELICSRSFG